MCVVFERAAVSQSMRATEVDDAGEKRTNTASPSAPLASNRSPVHVKKRSISATPSLRANSLASAIAAYSPSLDGTPSARFPIASTRDVIRSSPLSPLSSAASNAERVKGTVRSRLSQRKHTLRISHDFAGARAAWQGKASSVGGG